MMCLYSCSLEYLPLSSSTHFQNLCFWACSVCWVFISFNHLIPPTTFQLIHFYYFLDAHANPHKLPLSLSPLNLSTTVDMPIVLPNKAPSSSILPDTTSTASFLELLLMPHRKMLYHTSPPTPLTQWPVGIRKTSISHLWKWIFTLNQCLLPTTITKALRDHNWYQAMSKEYEALVKNGTEEFFSNPNQNLVGWEWIF